MSTSKKIFAETLDYTLVPNIHTQMTKNIFIKNLKFSAYTCILDNCVCQFLSSCLSDDQQRK